MTNTHTPLAWQVDRDHQTRAATDPITICAGSPDIAETWRFVAEVQGCGELGEQERDANARLIAAAPELLHALELVAWEKEGFDDHISRVVRAAIAKARGEL